MMLALPFILPATCQPSPGPAASILLAIGILLYPALLVFRLVRMIRQSQAYKRSRTPPTWKL